MKEYPNLAPPLSRLRSGLSASSQGDTEMQAGRSSSMASRLKHQPLVRGGSRGENVERSSKEKHDYGINALVFMQARSHQAGLLVRDRQVVCLLDGTNQLSEHL